MKLKLLFLFLFFVTLKVSAQIPADAIARFDHVFDSVCTKYNIKGASAAILVPGIGTWKGVYGISHKSKPVSEEMLFGIGSNTKTFISVLMLKLQEEGRLDLDDSIGTWIQNVRNVNGKITIRQLLNHSSGIYSYTDNEAWIDSIFLDQKRVWKPAEILQFIASPLFAPGQKWNYSNTNYLLAGMIIEKITQQPLHIALREKILSPHGLNNTFFIPDEAASPLAHAWTYVYNWNAPQQDIMEESDEDINAFYSSAWAAGAIMSTAEDNAIFWRKLMEGLIINEASLNELKQYKKISATVGYGLGIFREKNFHGRVVYSHGGTGFGYVNENIVDSINGIVISVLTNQDSVNNGIILNQLIKALHKVTQQNQVLGIEGNIAIAPAIQVYPNPTQGKIYVKLPQNMLAGSAVTVVNMLGQKVEINDAKYFDAQVKTIDLANVKPGIYIVVIQHQDRKYTRPIQVAK